MIGLPHQLVQSDVKLLLLKTPGIDTSSAVENIAVRTTTMLELSMLTLADTKLDPLEVVTVEPLNTMVLLSTTSYTTTSPTVWEIFEHDTIREIRLRRLLAVANGPRRRNTDWSTCKVTALLLLLATTPCCVSIVDEST